ncbi:MAG TPA: hypothetical protein DCL86_00510 [Bacteroidales bacterium]|jgi:hypothetical protein|nr:hypothetical protein [Bacteroidales bacterium]
MNPSKSFPDTGIEDNSSVNNSVFYKSLPIKPLLFLLLILLVSGCISIIKAPKRFDTDCYGHWSENNAEYSIKFIEITSDEVMRMNPDGVCLFGAWCPGSIHRLRLEDKSKPSNILFVSSNYDLKSMDKLFKSNLNTIYILSNARYGSDESLKIKQFVSELICGENRVTGVPQEFTRGDSCFVRK